MERHEIAASLRNHRAREGLDLHGSQNAEEQCFDNFDADVGRMMPARVWHLAVEKGNRTGIEWRQQPPGLECEDGCDQGQQDEAAARANDSEPEDNEPRNNAADPLDSVERVEDQSPDAQRVLQLHTSFEFDRRFQKTDGTDKAEPEQGDDESVE